MGIVQISYHSPIRWGGLAPRVIIERYGGGSTISDITPNIKTTKMQQDASKLLESR